MSSSCNNSEIVQVLFIKTLLLPKQHLWFSVNPFLFWNENFNKFYLLLPYGIFGFKSRFFNGLDFRSLFLTWKEGWRRIREPFLFPLLTTCNVMGKIINGVFTFYAFPVPWGVAPLLPIFKIPIKTLFRCRTPERPYFIAGLGRSRIW
jgi:hypothetical protein